MQWPTQLAILAFLVTAIVHHINSSKLPESFQQSEEDTGLENEEGGILTAFKSHLEGSLREYQSELHHSFQEKLQGFKHRKRRELIVDENLYWNINSETEIPTDFTIGKHFTCDGDDYIILGYNQVSAGTYAVDAEIYKFDTGTSSFTTTGVTIGTYGVSDIETFLVSGQTHIAVANGQFDASSYEGFSQILTFDASGPSVTHSQYMYTYGASALEAFVFEGDTYLGVANSRQDSGFKYQAETRIYLHAGSYFDEIVSLSTDGAHGIAAATLGFDLYVAVAQYIDNADSYTPGTVLYEMDISTDASTGTKVVEMIKNQVIASSAPQSVTFFVNEGHNYLAIANHLEVINGVETSETDSVIYWWASDDQFIEYQTIATDGAMQFEYLELEFDPSLLVVADLTGLRFYHFNDDAWWEEAETDLYLDNPSVRLTGIHVEAFNMDNVDYLLTASSAFWTTEERNQTVSNLFSFSHVNETTTTNTTSVYLPPCAETITASIDESRRNITKTIETLGRGLSKTSGKQVVTSDIIITGHVRVPVLKTKSIEITKGQDYEIDPALIASINTNNDRAAALLLETPDFVTKSTEQTIEGPVTFSAAQTIVTGNAGADSFTADDSLVSGIDLPYIDGAALRSSGDQTMSGQVTFNEDLTVGTAVTVSDLVSGILVPGDVMDKISSQTVDGVKTFAADVNFNANVGVDGSINSLDLNSDVVLTSRSATVAGSKTFSQGITLNQAMVVASGKTVDSVDVSEFATQVLTVSGGGTLIGAVNFDTDLTIGGSVSITNDMINDVDFVSAYNDAVFVDTSQTITANKRFLNNLDTEDEIDVAGTVNGIDISEDVFTLSTRQIVDSRIFVVGGGIVAQQNVNVTGTVNNVDLSEEAVLIDKNQTIEGLVFFNEDVVVDGDTFLSGGSTVDGVDLSEYAARAARTDQSSQSISGQKTFTQAPTIAGDLSVTGLINGVNVTDLYRDVLSQSRVQSFDIAVDVKSAIEISGDATLQGTIDAFSVPSDFVLLAGDDDISGYKTFLDLLSITGNLGMAATKTVNGKDLSVFDNNVLTNSGNQAVSTSDITFNNALSVSGDITVTGSIDGYTVPDDFVLLAGTQTISDCKTFDQADLTVTGDILVNDLEVSGTVNTVDIDSLYSDALMLADGDKCTIGGQMAFPTVAVEGAISVSGTVDGVNLATLTSTVVYLAGAQDISGDKTFTSGIHFSGDVTVNNHVNSLNFATTSSTVIYSDTAGSIRGEKTLSGGAMVTGSVNVDGLVNGVNLTLLDDIYLSKQYPQIISGAKLFTQPLHMADLNIDAGKTLDTIEPSKFLLLGSDETISATITFRKDVDIEGDLAVTGTINTVDIVELDASVVRLTGPRQVVEGVKSFPSITVHNNIVIDPGLVDGVDVSGLSDRVLRSDQSNDITVSTVFSGDVTVTGNLLTEADTGGVSISNILQDAVLLDEDFSITGTVILDSGAEITMTTLTFEDDLALTVNLDHTTLNGLLTTTIRVSTDQNITGNIVFNDNIELQDCLTIDGTTDTIDLSEHAVLKDGEQTISQCTRFQSGFRVNGNLTVGGTIDAVNVANLLASRVTYSTDQTITGSWTFDDVTVDVNVTIDGALNDIDVGDDLVITYENAVLSGTKDFAANMVVTQDLDTTQINDVDIVALSNKVVLSEGSFSISGAKTFQSAITIEANTDVTGLVNCVDVGLLANRFDTITTNFDASLASLNNSMRSQCIAASSMQSSLGEHPLLLTHWEDIQNIDNPAAGKFHSVIVEGDNTILGLSESYNSAIDRCIGTQLYLCPAGWMSCVALLDDLLPAATDVHLFGYNGETFIVLLPSQQTGQCNEHRDKVVDIMTILKLEDRDFSVTLHAPHALGATMFVIDGTLFLAVANYRDVVTHDTNINSTVYLFNNDTEEFELLQEIPTHGAFAVAHLSWRNKMWLCFANNVLDFKSPIYVFDFETNQFVVDEEHGTNHASDVSLFIVDDVPFAAISSEKLIGDEREAEFHRDITVLAYQGGQWNLLESIQGYGIIDTTAFAVDEFVYLVAVSLEGGLLSIYEWHHAGMFELYQTIPFSNQYSAHAFVHNHEILLALARPAFTSVDIYSWKSKIMQATIRGKTKDTVLQAW